MTNQLYIVLGMAMITASVLVMGNKVITWLMPSDTRRVRPVDVVKRLDNYRGSIDDPKLRQALSLLGADKRFYDAKLASSLSVVALAAVLAAIATLIFAKSIPAAVVTLALGLAATLPLSVALAKATVISSAATERQAFRSILSMYLMVLGVELRTHPIEIALRDIADVTYSPVAIRITGEIQRRIDRAAHASTAEGEVKDMSLGQALIDLGQDWAIPELELIGEITHGSVFGPEALSDMILQQSETMKKALLRDYAKKLEAQRPKLAMFALLQILPLVVFMIVPIMSSFTKSGL